MAKSYKDYSEEHFRVVDYFQKGSKVLKVEGTRRELHSWRMSLVRFFTAIRQAALYEGDGFAKELHGFTKDLTVSVLPGSGDPDLPATMTIEVRRLLIISD